MTPIEDKIRKLLELASHPNTPVDEARTAAHQAAKLMREHKVGVGVPAPIFGPPSFAPMPAWAAVGTLIHTMIDVMLREQPRPAPPPPPAPFDPMAHPEFWERWDRQQRAKKKRRRKRPNPKKRDPNWEKKRRT